MSFHKSSPSCDRIWQRILSLYYNTEYENCPPHWHTSFDRNEVLCESLWDVAIKMGKKVALINWGSEPFTIENGDRIAQLVIAAYERVDWEETDTLDETERGAGGFGHTGV